LPWVGPSAPVHPFPTRRSSDLIRGGADNAADALAELAAVVPMLQQRVCAVGEAAEVLLLVQQIEIVFREAEKRFRRCPPGAALLDRKSIRLNSSHLGISYAVFC